MNRQRSLSAADSTGECIAKQSGQGALFGRNLHEVHVQHEGHHTEHCQGRGQRQKPSHQNARETEAHGITGVLEGARSSSN